MTRATAIDHYFATLTIWLGMDNANVPARFPNLGRVGSFNLRFIQ